MYSASVLGMEKWRHPANVNYYTYHLAISRRNARLKGFCDQTRQRNKSRRALVQVETVVSSTANHCRYVCGTYNYTISAQFHSFHADVI